MLERAYGHFYKHWIMWKRSPSDIAWIMLYPFVGLISIGLFASYLIGTGAPMESLIFVFAGVVIWNFYDISQRAITYGITYEIWSDSLKHFFSTMSRERDYVIGNSAFGLVTSLVSLFSVGTIGFMIFGFNIFDAGVYLILGCLSVFMFANSVGLAIDYFMITRNIKYMSLIWISTGIIMIFSGIYYPVSVLPEPARLVSYALPPTHAVGSIRSALASDFASAGMSMAVSFALTAAYFLAGYTAFVRGVRKGKEIGNISRY